MFRKLAAKAAFPATLTGTGWVVQLSRDGPFVQRFPMGLLTRESVVRLIEKWLICLFVHGGKYYNRSMGTGPFFLPLQRGSSGDLSFHHHNIPDSPMLKHKHLVGLFRKKH
jgi:hypothetical protein